MTTASDNFNRANENPIVGWTTITGFSDLQIVSNATQGSGTSPDDNGAYHDTEFGAGDHYCQGKLFTERVGLICKQSDDDGYLLYFDGGTAVALYEINGGSFTEKDTAVEDIDGDDVKITYESGDIEVYHSDVLVSGFTFSDSTHDANTYCGIYTYRAGAGNSVDDWEGGDIAAGSTSVEIFRRRIEGY